MENNLYVIKITGKNDLVFGIGKLTYYMEKN